MALRELPTIEYFTRVVHVAHYRIIILKGKYSGPRVLKIMHGAVDCERVSSLLIRDSASARVRPRVGLKELKEATHFDVISAI